MLKNPVPGRRTARLGLLAVSLVGLSAAAAAWAAQPAEPDAGARGPSMPPEVQGSAPAYPTAALAGGVSGLVVLLVDVAADGSVTGAEVESADPPGVFEETTLEAVKSWRFQPAMEDGKPVAGRVRVPVTFEDSAKPLPAPVTPPSSARAINPEDYDWMDVNLADAGSLRQVECDAIKGGVEDAGVISCGVLKNN